MRIIGIIDIGSNSLRLVVAQVSLDNTFRIIDELKESVRLGESVGTTGKLSSAKIHTALETLKLFQELCHALGVQDIYVIATEAVRRASNKYEFIRYVKKRLNLDVQVLSGIEEAYYDYLGTINTLNFSDAILMDIGGSSTELALIKNREFQEAISFPFGAINLSKEYNLSTAIDPVLERKLNEFLTDNFKKLKWLSGELPLIGIGGSFRNICKIDKRQRDYPLESVHNYHLTAHSIAGLYQRLKSLSYEERTEIKGLSKDRADIIVGPLAEISNLLSITKIQNIYVSGSGLREGLLFKTIFKDKPVVPDVLDYSLCTTMKNFHLNEGHAHHVWELVFQLFCGLKDLIPQREHHLNILKTAALLHDCGIQISYYDHHKHSFYMILNSNIYGLTQKEILMAAWIASLHRKEESKMTASYRKLLTTEELALIQKLGLLLRIGESMDRRQNGSIQKVECEITSKSVSLMFSSNTNSFLESSDALTSAPLFKKIFKKQLIINTKLHET